MSNERNKFLKECYEKYQLDWMRRFGYSMTDFVKSLQEMICRRRK